MIKFASTLLVAALLAGCQRAPEGPPSVLGIPFAVPISSIKQHLPEDAKPTQFPLIPMYGYKLQFANPENWEVIVQDESPDELVESRIFAIYLHRSLGRPCTLKDTEAVISDLQKKYEVGFSTRTVRKLKEEEAVGLTASNERRLLTAIASCFMQNIRIKFTYIDLDHYQYRKPDEVSNLLRKAAVEDKEYKNRVLK